mgnify:CR=1 FL=1
MNADTESETPKERPIDKAVNHDANVSVPSEAPAPVVTSTPFVHRSFLYNEAEVPEAMRSSVEYLLSKTGRPTLCLKEYDVIRELNGKYTPEQIISKVDEQIEFKKRTKGNIRQVTFYLIKKVLCVQQEKENKRQSKPKYVASVKAPVALRDAQQVREALPDVSAPILPLDEAENIISEYTPARPAEKKSSGISPVYPSGGLGGGERPARAPQRTSQKD